MPDEKPEETDPRDDPTAPNIIRCPWCLMTSDKMEFHVGKELNDYDVLVIKGICPKCTNVFYPDDQTKLKEHRELCVGTVFEDKITVYCREHRDEFLFRVKGVVPKLENSLDPELTMQEIPEKHRRQ